MFADDELVNVLNSLESSVLIVLSKFAPKIQRIRSRLQHVKHVIVFNSSPSFEVTDADRLKDCLVYEELIAANSSDALTEPAHIDEHQTAIMLLTSGTTGVPKAAMLSHRALMFSVLQAGKMFPMPGMSLVLYNSFAWIGACTFLFASLMNGGKIVMMNG